MDVSDMLGGQYLKAEDIKKEVRVQIEHVQKEEVGGDEKLVLYFRGKDKGLVLNKTNLRELVEGFGAESDGWQNRQVLLFTVKVNYQGQMVPGLRLRPVIADVDVDDSPF